MAGALRGEPTPAAVMDRYWEEVWCRHDLDHVDEFVAEDFRLHVAGIEVTGREVMAPMLTGEWFAAFPDLRAEVRLRCVEADLVAEFLVFSGTHSGAPFRPGLFRSRGLPAIPARGSPIEFTQTCLTRLEGGRIAEMWEDFDRVRLFLQLGVTIEVPEG